jgi:arylsulfatase A-like enzyme
VVLILLDAARADRFSCYGYTRSTTPQMDALAKDGVVFLNHFSQATATVDALPAMFYSRYFSRPLFPHNASVPLSNPGDLFRTDDPESISLPRLLSSAGFRTAIISAHSWIKPDTRLAREVDELYDLSSSATYPEKYGYPPVAKRATARPISTASRTRVGITRSPSAANSAIIWMRSTMEACATRTGRSVGCSGASPSWGLWSERWW